MLSLEQAKILGHGDWLIHIPTGKRWKVNGEPKIWEKEPKRVRVPIKHGLYAYDYLTEADLQDFKFESAYAEQRIKKAIKHGASKFKKGLRVIYIKPKSSFAFGEIHKGDKGTIVAKWHAGEVVVQWDKLKDKAGGTFIVPINEIRIIGKSRGR